MDQRTCRWPDCDRVEPKMARRLCGRHYARSKSVGHPPEPWLVWVDRSRKSPMCKWPECDRLGTRRRLCTKHYGRAVSVADFESPWEKWNPPRPCEWCDVDFRGYRQAQRFCSSDCSAASYNDRNPDAMRKRAAQWLQLNLDKHRMKEHRRRAQRTATEAERFTEHDVRLAHGDTCYLCGRVVNFRKRWPDPMSPSLDHVIPLANGGTHTINNVAMVHLTCNLKKGARQVEQGPISTLLSM